MRKQLERACYRNRLSTAKRARSQNLLYGSTPTDTNSPTGDSNMDPEALKAFLAELADGLRADISEHCKKMDAKYDAVMDSLKKMKADADNAGVRQKSAPADDE